jgi:hypothetical protein
MTTTHLVSYTLTCGTRVHDTYASFTEINQRIADLQKALDNTPSTYSGTITVNQGFELAALNNYKALPSNAGEVIDLCIQHAYPVVKVTEGNFYSLSMEGKYARVQAYIDLIKAEVAEKAAKALQKQLDAQFTLDQFVSKFAPAVFAGNERWVNCYETSECYGGSEEGGWNYTCYTLVACFPLSQFQHYTPATLADISKGATTLLDAMGLEANLIALEALPAQSVTLSKPRYE